MQFEYGGDGLEPASMEGAKWPVEFERVLNYVKVKTQYSTALSLSLIVTLQAVNQHKDEPALSPAQLCELSDDISKDDDVIKKCSPQFIRALW